MTRPAAAGSIAIVHVGGASPSEVHATLKRRAAAGMSLQEYLLSRLEEDARTPTSDEVLDRAGGRAGGKVPLEAAVAEIRAERDSR